MATSNPLCHTCVRACISKMLHFLLGLVEFSLVLLSTVGLLGACSVIDGKGSNLGYIQSSPQAAADGSISIVYQNGDRCGDTGRYSTRIILQCDHNPVSAAAFARTESSNICEIKA